MSAPSGHSSPAMFIYKITTDAPDVSSSADPTAPVLPPAALDVSSDYVHMSTAGQVRNTLAAFFPTSTKGREMVYLLRCLASSFGSDELLWEGASTDGGAGPRDDEGKFPHLYLRSQGQKRLSLEVREVESVRSLVCEVGQVGWDACLERLINEGWLV